MSSAPDTDSYSRLQAAYQALLTASAKKEAHSLQIISELLNQIATLKAQLKRDHPSNCPAYTGELLQPLPCDHLYEPYSPNPGYVPARARCVKCGQIL